MVRSDSIRIFAYCLVPMCIWPLFFTHVRFGIVNRYGTSCMSTVGSPMPFTHVRFGIVNPYGALCMSTCRSPRRFSHRHFGSCNPYGTSCMSTFGSPRPFSLWQFGFYNPHAVRVGRLAPLSHDSLVAKLCSLFNFSSRAFSRGIHTDLTSGAHPPPPESGN